MYLGLDVGTSGVKATVIDDSGTIHAISSKSYPLLGLEENHRELDPLQVWESVKTVIHDVLGKADSSDIDFITVASLGEAIIPINKSGLPIMRSIIGSDIRGRKELESVCQQIPPPELTRITGLNLSTIYSLNKILYIRRHLPRIYAETEKFLCFTDFIVYVLTGEYVIDFSMASRTMAFDINKCTWSKYILDKVSVDPNLFSRTAIAGEIVGKILPSIAAETGLPQTVSVLIGPHDHICNALGAGAVEKGACSNVVGTTEGITAILGDEKLSISDISKNNISCQPFVLSNTYNTVAWHNTAGALINWFMNQFFCKNRTPDQTKVILDQLNHAYHGKPTRLLIQPYFSGATTQFMDDKAKGTILGLSLSTTREEIYQALLEGSCYECMLIVEALENASIPVKHLIVNGGGSKSDPWLSIKADMLGKPVYTVDCQDTGALGSAIIAAVANKRFSSVIEAAQNMVRPGKIIEPNMNNNRVYRERFEQYKCLYSQIKDINHLLN